MDRLFGMPLTDQRVFDRSEQLAPAVIQGLNVWFNSLMECEFFHADLHNGNLLLLDDGRLGFIDFGLVGKVPREHWKLLEELLFALGQQDAQNIARCLCEVGMTSRHTSVDALAADIEKFVSGSNKSSRHGLFPGGEQMDQMMVELARISTRHGVRFPRQFSLVLKQLLYFDRFMTYLSERGAHYQAPDWQS